MSKPLEDPFTLFPKEVWLTILNGVGSSPNILRMFQAYPKLDLSFQKMKPIWLFGEILPILMSNSKSKLGRRDLLQCRLVCSWWSSSVLQYLQKNAGLYPVHFSRPVFVARFLKMCEGRSSASNPFLSRSIMIETANEGCGGGPDGSNEQEVKRIWGGVLELAKRFGVHLWSLDVCASCDLGPDQISLFKKGDKETIVMWTWKRLIDILHNLPNLKEFTVGGASFDFNDSEMNELLELGYLAFPPLPLLTKLHIHSYSMSKRLSRAILAAYCRQFRSLTVGIESWRRDYKDYFPELEEFQLTYICKSDVPSVQLIFRELNASKLTKLSLVVVERLQRQPISLEQDVFQWLERFPNLRSLQIRGLNLVSGTSGQDTKSYTSLQELELTENPEINYNFLRRLPNLRQLSIELCKMKQSSANLKKEDKDIDLRAQLQTGRMYQSNVWKWLPKLRQIHILDSKDSAKVMATFEREVYEKLVRNTV